MTKTFSQSDVKVLAPCPFCGSSNIDPEGVASFKKEYRTQDMTWAKDSTPDRIENRPACSDCGATTDGDWNARAVNAQEAAQGAGEPNFRMCQAGARALPDVVRERGYADIIVAADVFRAMLAAAPQPEKRPEGLMLNDKAEITCEKKPESAEEGAGEIAAKIVERCRLFGTSTQAISEATAIITAFRAEVVEECAKMARSRGGLEFETVYGIADAIRSLGKSGA